MGGQRGTGEEWGADKAVGLFRTRCNMSGQRGLTVCLVAVLSLLAGAAQGADFRIVPSISVGEEFTDNVHETKTHRESEFITRLMPGLSAKYTAPALTADAAYLLDYRHYALNRGSNDLTHDLSARANLAAINNLLYVDASDEYQRASLNVTRDLTRESLVRDQTDRNLFSIAPYISLRPGPRTTLNLGYRFIDTRYSDPTAVDKMDHVAFLEGAHELSRRFSLTASYAYTMEFASKDDYRQHQAAAGFRYEYLDKSFVFAQAGNTWTNYDSGRRLDSLFWDAGASHDFGGLVATLATGVRYDEDPLANISQETFYTGGLEKRLSTGAIGVTLYYSEFAQADTDKLETVKYGAMIKGNYQFGELVNGTLALTAEEYEDRLLDSRTRLYLVEYGLNYLLAEKLTVGLSHMHVNSRSAKNEWDTRQVNRVILLVTRAF